MACIVGLIENLHLHKDNVDIRRWDFTKNGSFSVSSCYEMLEEQEDPSFPLQVVWDFKAPSKVVLFMWVPNKKKIPTIDNLQRHGFIILSICPFSIKKERISALHVCMMGSLLTIFLSIAHSILKFGKGSLWRQASSLHS